ncbi:hypothetical protein TCAL_17281 [Tigriopus californicus]|uniref:Cell cycle checkpoint control protein RAD9A n=1 Tax=Tigriopus californicus TaxID=6832 RepID=A0A553NYX3_TIGCA|nr:cell cycle checkpoint control protein RAD9A-like [Tigriopus californicus]TRY70631.1 hypothetical protein TCAL_17281 [Tigriopus californicus]
MKCIIPSPNVKVFARAIHSLAKIGDELYLVPQIDGLALRTINSSRSAFTSFLFNPAYFSVYDEQKTSDEVPNCKIIMRRAVAIFKSISQVDRMVEAACIQIDPSESQVRIELRCKFNVTKSYVVPFLEADTVKAQYDTSESSNHLDIDSKTLSSVFDSFLQNQEEVTMIASPGEFKLKNFIEDQDEMSRRHAVSTVFTMKIPEFQSYAIKETSHVTYCLKELRSFNGFAEAFSLPLSATFDVGGKPIVFALSHEGFYEAALVMATIDENSATDPIPVNTGERLLSHVEPPPKASTQREPKPGKTSHLTPGVTPILAKEPLNRELLTPDVMAEMSMDQGGIWDIEGNEETVPRSPPSKKARVVFKRCFDATFYPQNMTAATRVLAPDSDDDDES